MLIKSKLIDTRNRQELYALEKRLKLAKMIGFDIETFDDAHEGLLAYRKSHFRGVVFDVKRTTVAGFSIYIDGEDTAYYINLNHADEDNRLPWSEAKILLDAIPKTSRIICHNAPFEITMMGESLKYELGDNVYCTLQMAVSAYGPDEYDHDKWLGERLSGLRPCFREAAHLFSQWQYGDNMNKEQHELLTKVTAKQSKATHSYNGFVQSLTYGYGLKQAVKSWFNHDMTTFKDVLNGKKDMRELTGEEVVAYGADDAYWCVRLFKRFLEYMVEHCPNAINTYLNQENPMIHVYSNLWRIGLKVNHQAIYDRQQVERHEYAECLRELKLACRKLLPFTVEPHAGLQKYDKWYIKNPSKHRADLLNWINSPNDENDFNQCTQVSSSVGNEWAGEKRSNFSIQHYYKVRMIMYDLLQMKSYVREGKTQSDGEARGHLMERVKKYRKFLEEGTELPQHHSSLKDAEWLDACEAVLQAYNKMISIDQRVKLYINAYLQLTDAKTSRMYPVLSSKLASRRMAMSYPNGMQLSKRGESTYVRGFYIPDTKDHVLISVDWSQIELVLIGEFSGDPEFAKAYGQTPYQDLHLGAAADVLSVMDPSITEEMLLNCDTWEDNKVSPFLLKDINGNSIPKGKRKGYWRTVVGKGSNFNYWYSGSLSTVGETLGWIAEQMWGATDSYRSRFSVAEDWRVDQIEQARWKGYVELPDGLRRYRWEATYEFATQWNNLMESYNSKGVKTFGDLVLKRIATRAGNQIVNSIIQGSCATLAKRSILELIKEIKRLKLKANFKMPIHDELVCSVHKNDAVELISVMKRVMGNHPEIINNLVIDSTASIGLTFEPFHQDKAPVGQIELDEPPEVLGWDPSKPLNEEETQQVIDYLFSKREEILRDA